MTRLNLLSTRPYKRRRRLTVAEWEEICNDFVAAFTSPKYLVSLMGND